MNWDDVCLHNDEGKFGANGDLDWNTRVTSTAEWFVDYVYENFADDGIHLEYHIQNGIRRMLAVAMLAQLDYDWEKLKTLNRPVEQTPTQRIIEILIRAKAELADQQ